METLIAPDILLDLCDPSAPGHGVALEAMRSAAARGRVWAYAGGIDRVAAGLRERGLTAAESLTDGTVQWLSALAPDAAALGEPDPLAVQLSLALGRLGPGAILVTADPALRAACAGAMGAAEYGGAEVAPRPMEFIDLFRQQDRIRGALEARLANVLRHGRYILGPEVAELEERLAEYVGVGHCVSVASGTDSLLIALMALGIGPGDEVITAPYTWISTAEVVQLVGARPVFVDIDPATYNIDPALVADAVGERTRAIMPVSIFGQPAEIERIAEVSARAGGIPVIEDAAQSFGSERFGRRSCGLSEIASTSFFPSKPLGGYGDGGALFATDAGLAGRMRQIRNHGQSDRHLHPLLGINGRLDTLQAAVLLAKLEVFDHEVARRRVLGERYDALIRERVPGDGARVLTPRIAAGNTSVYAQYTVQVDRRDEVMAALGRRGVPSVAYYARPLHLQPVFAALGHRAGDFPVTERVASRGLSLPMGAYLREGDQERVVAALAAALDEVGAGEVTP